MVTDTECAGVCGALPFSAREYFFRRRPQQQLAPGVPTLRRLQEGGILHSSPRLLRVLAVQAAGSGLRRHAGLTCPIPGKHLPDPPTARTLFPLKTGNRV